MKKQQLQKIMDISLDLVFEPTNKQRKCKAELVISLEENSSASLETITLAQAISITGDTRLKKWWPEPGFRRWLTNKQEFRSSLEYLCNLGLNVAEDMLQDDNPKTASARVSLLKILLEAAGKLTRVKEVKLLDEAVNKMDKAQLEEYLGKLKVIKNDNK